MDRHPLVSFVVVNYNYAAFLPKALESIAAQGLPPERVQVILADDGSTDNSVEVAAQAASFLRPEAFETVVLSHCGRPGLVKNAGLDRVRGDYFLCLDSDDFLHPDYCRECLDLLHDSPETAFAYPDYLVIEGDSVSMVQLPDFDADLLRGRNIVSNAVLMRKSVLEAGLRYRIGTAYEDWDLWVRCASAGFTGAHIPRPLFCYRRHPANYSVKARQDDGRAKALIVVRNPRFFAPQTLAWAEALLAGEPWAVPFPRGLIPDGPDAAKLAAIGRTVMASHAAGISPEDTEERP